MTENNAWKDYLADNRERFISELMDFLKIPSISALPVHAGDVAQAAEWAAQRLKRAGLENVEVLTTSGHPSAYGEWLHAPGKPTVMIYGHLDTQPADPLELWESPPFEPVRNDERIYARGASDDKGNLLSAVAAVEALLATRKELPLNVKFFLEGEEEIGSPSLPELLDQRRELLSCDLVASADALQWSPEQPKIDLGFRGIACLEITVHGPETDQHSGLYGGVLQNPNHALAHILASMHDTQGRVLVEGFYDEVLKISNEDRQRLAGIPFDEQELISRLKVTELVGDPDYTPLERIGARPTLEICGLGGGFQDAGIKNIIPAKAMAKISARLVADQNPQHIVELVERHVKKHTPAGVRVEVCEIPGTAIPYRMPPGHPGGLAAAKVLEEIFGRAPYLTLEGGSIAACSLFLQKLGVYTVGFGFCHEDENLHAPNEFFRLSTMDRGQQAYVHLLEELSTRL